MDWTVEFSDLAIIFATLVGPILAVQSQKWLERRRDVRGRQEAVFRDLMATRASGISPRHVEALNAVPTEFVGKTPQARAVLEAWRLHLEHLNGSYQADSWVEKRHDLYIDLLSAISSFLRFDFDKVQLKREVYHPRGFIEMEQDQERIRRGMAKILSGDGGVPVEISSIPFNPQLREQDLEVRELFKQWLESQLAKDTLEGRRAQP